jgi:hypothetical protein
MSRQKLFDELTNDAQSDAICACMHNQTDPFAMKAYDEVKG